MSGLDPEIACHQLTIDHSARAVAQRRRKQSDEKTLAAEKIVRPLRGEIYLGGQVHHLVVQYCTR